MSVEAVVVVNHRSPSKEELRMLPVLTLYLVLVSDGGEKIEVASNEQESEKALEVKGNRRGFSLIMPKKSKKDEIDFVDVKTNYKEEIINSLY